MPYIKQEYREILSKPLDDLWGTLSYISEKDRAGCFTYILYQLLKSLFAGKFYLRAMGIGCVMCAILEWYRRSMADYEDEKIQQNGDVK